MRKAVGFYWTLPVPWAGFIKLPHDFELAIGASRTLRYQRELIRRYASAHRFELIAEKAFLEIEPDRGSEYVREPLEEAAEICRKSDATLILVDFGAVQDWRNHQFIDEWAISSSITVEKIFPDEILIDGYRFDPHVHFQQWRRAQYNWSESKADRKAQALKRAWEFQEAGFSYSRAAASLNAEGIHSLTGKDWTKDSLRKFVRSLEI